MGTGGQEEHSLAPTTASTRFRDGLARLGGAQKSTIGVPAYLRFVNRRAGGWLAAGGYGLGLTPNHLTALSAGWSVAAILLLCLATPTVPTAILVTAALLVGYAFDSADGQLSRLRGDGTPAGEWLDHVVDMAKTASLHAAVLVSLARFAELGSSRWLLVPMAFGIAQVTFFFAMMLRDQLGAKPTWSGAATPTGAGSVTRSVVLLPMDYAALCVTFVFLPWAGVFLAVYGALGAFTAAFASRSFIKAYRTLAG